MNALLNHSWGQSPASDRVWSFVTGMAPGRAVRAPIVALQLFIDDSCSENGLYVLAGYFGSAETWAAFSREWEEMLPYGVLDKNNKYHFKMSQMALSPERLERAKAFFRIIDSYNLQPIYLCLRLADIEGAKRRIWALNGKIKEKDFYNKFHVIFKIFMDGFVDNREEMREFLKYDDEIEFIFDEQSEKQFILQSYFEYVANHKSPEQMFYKSAPRFENDQRFLPLQAADLLAWLVREWHEVGCPDNVDGLVHEGFKSKKKDQMILGGECNEDTIVKHILRWIKTSDPHAAVYDSAAVRPWP